MRKGSETPETLRYAYIFICDFFAIIKTSKLSKIINVSKFYFQIICQSIECKRSITKQIRGYRSVCRLSN